MARQLLVLACCVLLFGCASKPAQTARNEPAPETSAFDTVPWRWEDYSNRVWISVSGVGVESFVLRTNSLKRFGFSYSPSTGKSPADAIAIRAFDMFAGDKAERLLLKVLFGMEGSWLSHSNVVRDGKAFHIYTFQTRTGTAGGECQTNTAYFDATKYHNLF
jgi:hypothetical protein